MLELQVSLEVVKMFLFLNKFRIRDVKKLAQDGTDISW